MRALSMAPAERFGLSGTYVKDKGRSDSQEKLMDKLEVPWLLRKAVGLLATLKVSCFRPRGPSAGLAAPQQCLSALHTQFEDSEKELKVTVKASIPGFDSAEVYR